MPAQTTGVHQCWEKPELQIIRVTAAELLILTTTRVYGLKDCCICNKKLPEEIYPKRLPITSGITAGGVLELRPPGGVSPLKLINFV